MCREAVCNSKQKVRSFFLGGSVCVWGGLLNKKQMEEKIRFLLKDVVSWTHLQSPQIHSPVTLLVLLL